MDSYEKLLASANDIFSKVVKKPEKFMDPQTNLFEDIKLLSKVNLMILSSF